MKISHKMILIFSVMMIVAVSLLSGYAMQSALRSYDLFSAARFHSMADGMARSIEQQISMMDLTADELLDNVSFMSALNQLTRDDSDDRKVATASRKAVLQQLYRSPLVNSFYRVSFYTRSGEFVTSRFEKDDYLVTSTDEARRAIAALPFLDQADALPTRRQLLPPHDDIFSVRRGMQVYGILRAVLFHGKPIGYLEISDEVSNLADLLSRQGDDSMFSEALFDDGSVFYAQPGLRLRYPLELQLNTVVDFTDPATRAHHSVMHIRSEWLQLNFFLAQDHAVLQRRYRDVRRKNILAAVVIVIPTLVAIVFISLRLTRSTRRLTQKVRRLPVDHVLENQEAVSHALSETVTGRQDAEVNELERVFNAMMLRLRDNAVTESALREGALQAQLSALQTQINPHFIYNTLNIISAKSMESGNLEVIEICDQFASLLRYSTDTRSYAATLREEIDNVQNYLLLAKARYEDNLEFAIDIPEHLRGVEIPKLTLQPLVENALSHGFNGQNVRRMLTITGHTEMGQLVLEIRDNGTGFPPDELKRLQRLLRKIDSGSMGLQKQGGHIGLANTCLRLYYYSHGAMHVTLRNDHGAVVTLVMPYQVENG